LHPIIYIYLLVQPTVLTERIEEKVEGGERGEEENHEKRRRGRNTRREERKEKRGNKNKLKDGEEFIFSWIKCLTTSQDPHTNHHQLELMSLE